MHEARLRTSSLWVFGMATAGRSPEAESLLAEVRGLAAETGEELLVQEGDERELAAQVIDASSEDDVEAVVVGTRRRSPVGKVFLGGITQQIVLEARGR